MNEARRINPAEDPKNKEAQDSIQKAVQEYANKRQPESTYESLNEPGENPKMREFRDAKVKEYADKMRAAKAAKADAAKVQDIKDVILNQERPGSFAGMAKEKSMDDRRIEALRQEVSVLGDALKMRGIDMEAQSAKGLFGRMVGGFRRTFNADVREYESKLALLNRLTTQMEEDAAGKDYWAKRADRASTRPQSPGPSAGGVFRGGPR